MIDIIKGVAVNGHLVMWWDVAGRGIFSNAMIRTQSFSEPMSLNFIQVFLSFCFCFPLCGTRGLE